MPLPCDKLKRRRVSCYIQCMKYYILRAFLIQCLRKYKFSIDDFILNVNYTQRIDMFIHASLHNHKDLSFRGHLFPKLYTLDSNL